MDNNKADQQNPNNAAGGGIGNRPAGYQGAGTTADLNNHANQGNPNNSQFGGGQGAQQPKK